MKLRNSKLKLQRKILYLPWDLFLRIGLFFKFSVTTWFTKQITKFVKQGRSENFYKVPDWSFEVSILSFIFNFEISDQSFETRGEGTLKPFWLKWKSIFTLRFLNFILIYYLELIHKFSGNVWIWCFGFSITPGRKTICSNPLEKS